MLLAFVLRNMKKLFLGLSITLFIITSCCKADLAIGLNVEYTQLTGNHELTVLWKNNISGDTNPEVYPLNDQNNHQVFISLNSGDQYDYYLQVDSLLYSDTISNFSFETKGRNCNIRVENVSYLLNGNPKSDQQLVIQ